MLLFEVANIKEACPKLGITVFKEMTEFQQPASVSYLFFKVRQVALPTSPVLCPPTPGWTPWTKFAGLGFQFQAWSRAQGAELVDGAGFLRTPQEQ